MSKISHPVTTTSCVSQLDLTLRLICQLVSIRDGHKKISTACSWFPHGACTYSRNILIFWPGNDRTWYRARCLDSTVSIMLCYGYQRANCFGSTPRNDVKQEESKSWYDHLCCRSRTLPMYCFAATQRSRGSCSSCRLPSTFEVRETDQLTWQWTSILWYSFEPCNPTSKL